MRREPFTKWVASINKVYRCAHTSKIIWNIDANGISSRLSWWLWRPWQCRETQIIQDYFKPPCVSDQSNESRSSQWRRLLRFREEIAQKENVAVSSGWTFKSKEAPLGNLEYRTFIIKRRGEPFPGQFLLRNKKSLALRERLKEVGAEVGKKWSSTGGFRVNRHHECSFVAKNGLKNGFIDEECSWMSCYEWNWKVTWRVVVL